MTNQQFQDPFVAVVIDPNRTISAGRVDIGAFRTYPENYKPSKSAQSSEYQSIPLNKIEDFGVHADAYYPLTIEHFKSSLDEKILGMLWEKYWVATLSQSPLVVNREYMTGQAKDLAEKLGQASESVSVKSVTTQPIARTGGAGDDDVTGRTAGGAGSGASAQGHKPQITDQVAESRKREDSTALAKVARDG